MDINFKTLFKIVIFIALIYVLYLVSDLLLLFFVSLILSALIDPFANWFQKYRVPRALAVLLVYVILFALIAVLIILLTPILVQDMPQLIGNIKKLWDNVEGSDFLNGVVKTLQSIQTTMGFSAGEGASQVIDTGKNVGNAISGVFYTISGFFGGLVSLVLILVITFYMVVQDDPLKKIFTAFVPAEKLPYILELVKKVKDKLGSWLRAQLVLSLIVGLLVFVFLSIFQIRYAAILALLSALLEFVPYVGPIIATIPGAIIAFSQGGFIKMMIIIAVYVIIQQIENNLLIPKVMQRAVGLNPIVSIFAILAGAKLAGVIGALIAIPVATALSVIFKDVWEKRT